MRWLPPAFLALLSGCFGQPEDLFAIYGSVTDGQGNPVINAPVLLERDEGASEDGCSDFSSFITLTTDEIGAFEHKVIRQQTRGRLSEHRCFRAIAASEDGRRTIVVWPFAGDDVRLPQLKLWPQQLTLMPSFGASQFSVGTLPESSRFLGAGGTAFVYRSQIDSELGTTWRSSPTGTASQLFPRYVGDTAMGAQAPKMIVAAVQRIQRFDRDPLGQLRLANFENRLETAPLPLNPRPSVVFPTRGGCDFASADGGCALTDGDPKAVLLPDNTRELIVDFAMPYNLGNQTVVYALLIRKIWVDGPWTGLIVELNVEDTPDYQEFNKVQLDKAALESFQVSRDDPLPGLDFDVSIRGRGFGVRRLRIRAVNQDQSVPIRSIGELSIHEAN